MDKKLAAIAVLAAAAGLICAPQASADVNPGCRDDRWGFLGSQTRSICDSPKSADGSWVRFRMVWIPAHNVPLSTYCSTYSCSTSGGYWLDDQIFEKVKYPVTPDTIVPGEPDWLPPSYTDANGFTPLNFN